MADIRFVEDRVEVDGPLRTNGSVTITGSISFTGSAARSVGKDAGYSFSDRSATGLFAGLGDKRGERFVWYADQGTARLWSGGDMLSITYSNPASGSILIETPGMLKVESVQANVMLLTGVGVLNDVLTKLQSRVTELEKQVAALKAAKSPVPSGGNGRPSPIPR